MRKSSNAARACRPPLAALSSGLVALLLLGSAIPSEAALTGSSKLAAVYESILAAQFDRASAELKQTCPPAPPEACLVLEVVSEWWQIQIDPTNRSRDRLLNERARAAINAAEAWTTREPRRAEAWFYRAGSYAPLVQWQVLRGERVSAARNGNRIREALEVALGLDPTLADAHFGIGIYEYYADVASAGAKLFRWLLFLPGGDRVKGLEAIMETRRNGALLRGEAEYQLHQIDIWYEHKPGEAIELLKTLDTRYPTNPLFLQRIAEISDEYLHDARASAAAWQALIDRATRDRVYDAARIVALAEQKRRAIVARTPRPF
jgi:hypothetical protein